MKQIEQELLDERRSMLLQSSLSPTERGYLDIGIVLAKHKKFLVVFTSAVTLLTAALTLLLPNYYSADAKIMPPQQAQSVAVTMLGQLSPLVNAATGKDLGLRNQNELYVAMLRSRTVADSLIDGFSLMSVYKAKIREEARRQLRSNSEIGAGKDGIITITVEDRDPALAANLANGYVTEIGKLTKSLAVSDAAKQRLFFQQEVETATGDLTAAEDDLRNTEQKTGIIHLDSQAKLMMESIARVRAQVSAKQVQVQAMKSYATLDNPDLKLAEQELAALRAQAVAMERGTSEDSESRQNLSLSKVPSSGLEYIRKVREVKYREALLELLKKQYEISRIDESKNAAIIQVLDPAITPERKSGPHRGAIVALAFLMALTLGAAYALIREQLEKSRQDPERENKLRTLRYYLFGSMPRP